MHVHNSDPNGKTCTYDVANQAVLSVFVQEANTIEHVSGTLRINGKKGIHDYGRLYLGDAQKGKGYYEISGEAQLSVHDDDDKDDTWLGMVTVGRGNQGIFKQSGGGCGFDTLVVGSYYYQQVESRYELSGGSLGVRHEKIGAAGYAKFLQTDGAHGVTCDLKMGLTQGLARFVLEKAATDPGGTTTLQVGPCSYSPEEGITPNELIIGAGTGGQGEAQFEQSGEKTSVKVVASSNLGGGILRIGDTSTGSYSISKGSLQAEKVYLSEKGQTGTLEIQHKDSSITVLNTLSFGSASVFEAVTDSEIAICLEPWHDELGEYFAEEGAFELNTTSSSDMAGLGNLTLTCEFAEHAGQEENFDNLLEFEVGGKALTGEDDFVEANFLMNELVVGIDPDAEGATEYGRIIVCVVDDYDNQPTSGDNEALYVNTLVLRAGPTFAYWDEGEGVIGQPDFDIYYKNGGNTKQFYMGDANLSGAVDGGDYSLWADHYNETASRWEHGDFNGDRVVNGADYTIWSDNYGSGMGGRKAGGGADKVKDLIASSKDGDFDGDGDIDGHDVKLLLNLEK